MADRQSSQLCVTALTSSLGKIGKRRLNSTSKVILDAALQQQRCQLMFRIMAGPGEEQSCLLDYYNWLLSFCLEKGEHLPGCTARCPFPPCKYLTRGKRLLHPFSSKGAESTKQQSVQLKWDWNIWIYLPRAVHEPSQQCVIDRVPQGQQPACHLYITKGVGYSKLCSSNPCR